MTPSTCSLNAHQHLKASMTACSWSVGWRSLLLRAYIDPPRVDEFMTPPTADQLIVLVTGGSCDIEARYGGRVQRAHYETGHIGMTAPGQEAALRWEGSGTHSTLQLHLSADARRRVLENFTDRDPALIEIPNALQIVDPVLQHVMLGLFDALRSGAPDLYAETAAEFLIAHVLIRHAGFVSPTPVSPARNRLQRVDEFMRAHLDEPLSLEAIARETGLSRFHTLRLFKRAFGETPVRRLARLRMERAKTYLAAGDEPVTEIAFRCGYENPAHFASAFRRWTGVSPSEYRADRKVPTSRR
jgi:AraC family transcriptional regulator